MLPRTLAPAIFAGEAARRNAHGMARTRLPLNTRPLTSRPVGRTLIPATFAAPMPVIRLPLNVAS